MSAPRSTALSGWKEIAAHLGVSVRTAQQREKQLGMPVHHEPGLRGPVFAYPAELDDWRQLTRISECAPQNSDPPDREMPPVYVQKAWLRVLRIASVPMLALLAATAYTLTPHGPLSDFRVEGKNLIAMNAKGRELWRHAFELPLVRDVYVGDNKARHSWIGDVTGHGDSVLLFEHVPVNRDDVGTELLCFAMDGRTLWQFKPGMPLKDGGGNRMLPPYTITNLDVLKGRRTEDTRIAVTSLHWLNQPAQVAILLPDGRVIGEYWHPGHFNHSTVVDLNHDGRKELLLAGVNNGNHQATLVVLDPLQIRGLMTPKEMSDHKFEILGMPGAREKAVVFFPRSCISHGQPYNRVSLLRVTDEQVIVEVAEGTDIRAEGFVYEMDYTLRVQNVEPTSFEVIRAHRELEARGEVDHPYLEECERLKAAVIVQRN